MYHFGKFTAHHVPFKPNGQTDASLGASGSYYVIYRNEAGDDLVDVLSANPHPFYIAVDESGHIVTMSDDPEAIQIAGLDIIGLDSDFGVTRGKGGNIYGALWDGEAIIAPPQPLPDLTARQFWLAALELGITDEGLLAAIADPDDALYIEEVQERAAVAIDIRKATSFRRNYPLVDDMAAVQNIPPQQMDALWVWATQIE